MQRLTFQPRSQICQGKPNIGHRWDRPGVLLILALVLLGGCGRAEQRAEQASPVPLSPATSDTGTATAAAPSATAAVQPTLSDALRIPSVTAAFIQTSIAASRDEDRATATAKAAWAQTPEPTILPPADGPRLRDLWPAAAQQAAPPTRLYLRSFDVELREPDTFWEVRLSDAQIRRLPAVERDSIDQSAQVSPDGRFLAYVTGNARAMERTLRVLDLAQDSDLGIALPANTSSSRCRQPFAWSSDGRSLAVVTVGENEAGGIVRLQLYDIGHTLTPQTLLELPDFLDIFGWLDAEHLLLVHWKPSVRPAQLLSVDRQGHVTLVRELRPQRLLCASLSPDGQNLIYNENKQVKRLQLSAGQEELFPYSPNDLFWIGDGRTLLISRFSRDRRVWLHSLDRLQEASQNQSGIFLSPPYQTAYEFGIIGVSPDHGMLVACELAPHDNPRIRTGESRTWLYSIPEDRWTLIHTNPNGGCDLVLGWSSAGGTR